MRAVWLSLPCKETMKEQLVLVLRDGKFYQILSSAVPQQRKKCHHCVLGGGNFNKIETAVSSSLGYRHTVGL